MHHQKKDILNQITFYAPKLTKCHHLKYYWTISLFFCTWQKHWENILKYSKERVANPILLFTTFGKILSTQSHYWLTLCLDIYLQMRFRADMKNSTLRVGWKIKKIGMKISMGNKWEVFNIFSVQTSIIFVKKLSKCKCIVIKDGYGLHAARVPPDWHVICRTSSMNDKTVLSQKVFAPNNIALYLNFIFMNLITKTL